MNRSTSGKKRQAPKSAFAPGQSGNPAGRPKKTQEAFELEAACRARSPDALEVLLELMVNSKQDNVRFNAANAIIERAHGKALQRSEIRSGPLDDLPREALKELKNALTAATGALEPAADHQGSVTH